MKKILNVDLVHLNNGAHFLFITDAVKRVVADAKVKTKVAAELTALETAFKAEDKALKLSQASLLSREIKAADKLRGKYYRTLQRAVAFFKDHPNEELVKHAKHLEQLIKDYAIDPKMQLDRETGLLLNLIDDLQNKFTAEVTALNLGEVVDALKQANDKLRTHSENRANERAAKITGQLRAAQEEANKAYRKLVDKVNAFVVVEGEADYADFVDKMNEQVSHYKKEVLPSNKKKDEGKKPAPDKKPGGDKKKPDDAGKKPEGKKPEDGGNPEDKKKNGGKDHGEVEITPKK